MGDESHHLTKALANLFTEQRSNAQQTLWKVRLALHDLEGYRIPGLDVGTPIGTPTG